MRARFRAAECRRHDGIKPRAQPGVHDVDQFQTPLGVTEALYELAKSRTADLTIPSPFQGLLFGNGLLGVPLALHSGLSSATPPVLM